MPVAQLTLELRIEHAQSLKDRRQVVRSLKDQLKQGFNVSVAELDEAVVWQSATLGVVAISRSRDYLHGLIEEVERAARRIANELGAELADSFWEYLESLIRRLRFSGGSRRRPLVNDHPIDAEPVPQLSEAMREKRLRDGHEHLTTILEQPINSLRLLAAVDAQR